jgi:signal transduction histidine kinase
MGGSHAVSVRTAALGMVGVSALAVAAITGHGSHDGFFLAAAGGFSLGIAAALAIADARADGRADGPGAERTETERATARAAPASPAAPVARANGHDAPGGQGSGAGAVARATVAAVAHDMSNPLASLRSNLEWLRDALEAGRLEAPADQAEAREVLRDAREAAERLRADVGALRAAGRGEAAPPSG